jgi:EARLY FLOWERING 3 protein
MKGAIDDGKEISPMFPRLHVKDAEKGGPKAPPRNKMALYEQFSIPSQSFASGGPGPGSLFSLPLRNITVPTTSSNVSHVKVFKLYLIINSCSLLLVLCFTLFHR